MAPIYGMVRRVEEAARLCELADGVVAVGVNCVAPAHVGELIQRIRTATRLPVIVYPNSGEVYDAGTGTWSWPPGGVREARWVERPGA